MARSRFSGRERRPPVSPPPGRGRPRAAARAHVDEVVGGGEQVQVVVDHDDRRSGVEQPVEHPDQRCYVERVQAGGWLVEDVQRAALAGAKSGCDPKPLGLTAGQGRRRLAETQVAQADLGDGPQRRQDRACPVKNARASSTLRPSTSAMLRPSMRTARVASLKRVPLQVGHGTAMSGRYWTSRSMWPIPRQVGHWPSRVLNEKCPGFQRRRRAYGDSAKTRRIWSNAPE